MSHILKSIRRRAHSNALEVEHILKAALLRIEGLPELLDELSASENWSDSNLLPDGSHVVPFARWARVASAYCRDGIAGLRKVLDQPGHERFVLALLEELHSSEAVDAVMDFFSPYIDSPKNNPQIAHEIASSLNHILCFKPELEIKEAVRQRLCVFTTALVVIASDEAKKAMAVGLFRAVGDEATLSLLDTLQPFASPWDYAISSTKKSIRKRLKTKELIK
jgi:hypothetical protein